MNQPIAQYCESCGKSLTAQARFCGRCGKAVLQLPSMPVANQPAPLVPGQQSVPAPQQAAVLQSSETIVAALPAGTQRTGFLGMHAEGFVLVLTNMRILVAKQTTHIMRENARQAKEAARRSGEGFLGQWGAVISSYSSQRYLQMDPQAILDETSGNYSIPINQIRSARIKEDYDPEDGRSEVRLTLNTVNDKIEFNYTQTSRREIQNLLQRTLGNLVH